MAVSNIRNFFFLCVLESKLYCQNIEFSVSIIELLNDEPTFRKCLALLTTKSGISSNLLSFSGVKNHKIIFTPKRVVK